MHKHRIVLGPILIGVVIVMGLLDQWIEGVPLAPWLRPFFWNRETAPPGIALFILIAVISILAARELAAILKANGVEASKRITTAAAFAGLLVSCVIPIRMPSPVAVALVCSAAVGVLVLSLLFHSRRRTVEGVVASAGGTLLAFVYLGLMFGFILAIRREHSVWVLAWVILVTKSCDIGAYYVGKSIGKHKLIYWLSPGKTWEGLIGGVVTSAAVGAVGLWLLHRGAVEPKLPPIWLGLTAGALFGLTGQFGDLIESLFKRDAGIKDASSVIPGFGGVLDVVDSPLMVAPIAYWWLYVVGTGSQAGVGLH